MQIVMVGTGYVGLVSGTCLAEVGHNVTCVDLNEAKIALLKDGQSPIFEPGLETMIRRNLAHERLAFTTDLPTSLAGAQVAFIAVGTPEGEDGSADLVYVNNVAKAIGEHAQNDLIVVVKSTVPVGTCDLVEETINTELAKRSAKLKITVASNPEFLKEGDAVSDFMKPDRIIVGFKDGEGEAELRDLYKPFITDDPGRLLAMDRRSSELSKYAANSMLATRISFMNELSRLCDQVGADIDNVRRSMGADTRIGRKFLYAGPGYGGSCFPKDVAALLKSGAKYGVEFSVLKAVSDANRAQKSYVAGKINRHFQNNLAGKKVAVWGLAFKPGTDDVREAPAKVIIDQLLGWGATVVGHDPEAQPNFAKEFGARPNLSYAKTAYDAISKADALVLVTEWSEYKRPNWDKVAKLMAQKIVFDFRNQYEPRQMRKLGFHYECVGRPDAVVKI